MATSNENLFIVVLKQKIAAVRTSFVGSTSLVKPTQSEATKELLCLLLRKQLKREKKTRRKSETKNWETSQKRD